MTIKALVMSDRPDEYTGKKGLVKQQIITVMDQSETGERLAQPIEYALSDVEKPVHAGKLQDSAKRSKRSASFGDRHWTGDNGSNAS